MLLITGGVELGGIITTRAYAFVFTHPDRDVTDIPDLGTDRCFSFQDIWLLALRYLSSKHLI